MFLTGVFGGTGVLKEPLSQLLLSIFGAAVIGSLVGYLTGRFFGKSIENRPDSLLFKKKNLDSTRDFFDKYGVMALVISRFLPIVRTFTPILAGIIKMSWFTFVGLNLLGGFLWVGILVTSGYYLGHEFPWIINYVQYIILFFLGITTFTDPSKYGLSITLGGGEVRPYDMAEVFGTFANGGIKEPLVAITKITAHINKMYPALAM